MTTTKQNVTERTGDGANMVKDYTQKIQYRTFRRSIAGYGTVAVTVRFDDDCANGHCDLSVTGSFWEEGRRVIKGESHECGCIHDRIAHVFPELKDAIAFHLCGTQGPMHYPANALYFAGDRDCYGRAKGEPSRWEYGVKFNASPVGHRLNERFYKFLTERAGTGDFTVSEFVYDGKTDYKFGAKYSLNGFGSKWHECPFDDKIAADEFCLAMNTCKVEFTKLPTAFSEGKARELDLARSSAIWPDATDEVLSLPKEELKAILVARLPELLSRLRAIVEGLGFDYDFPTKR